MRTMTDSQKAIIREAYVNPNALGRVVFEIMEDFNIHVSENSRLGFAVTIGFMMGTSVLVGAKGGDEVEDFLRQFESMILCGQVDH